MPPHEPSQVLRNMIRPTLAEHFPNLTKLFSQLALTKALVCKRCFKWFSLLLSYQKRMEDKKAWPQTLDLPERKQGLKIRSCPRLLSLVGRSWRALQSIARELPRPGILPLSSDTAGGHRKNDARLHFQMVEDNNSSSSSDGGSFIRGQQGKLWLLLVPLSRFPRLSSAACILCHSPIHA